MDRTNKFAENLKCYRMKHNLTQKQLAEQIGYTEKSISQWELGNAFPTIETILKLAELFKITLDEFMFGKMSSYYFLGIDGGGTKTSFKLVDENGLLINQICKGSSNPNDIGIEKTFTVLSDGIGEVCRGIPYSQITMFAGIAGGGLTSDNAQKLNRFFSKFGFYAFDNGSDVENLVSLSDNKKSVLVIMGTGFIVYAVNKEERKRISGWGQFFDEGGSGYTLGRDAITAVLCASDGSGKQTALTSLIENRIGESAEKHLAEFYKGGKRYISQFAEFVFTAAQDGDQAAIEILEKNMCFVADKINTALSYLGGNSAAQTVPVLFSGGICENHNILFPLIKKHITADNYELAVLEAEQVDGALNRARNIFKTKGER
ncbi:MAG: XRE family transcriptional regulator [Clostridia bacterium]|nr:XRE family transcriptional regulator [Clostridia bacterium]